ncbi:hypothetical protein R4O66_001440 [Salmonella enterica]|nr:hypothetical protein [Salmonella enterica]EKK6343899.1 hypothetical protein [Salmonella enterica]ELO7819584.1 hypothetical protein [Salmonella enterica]ELR6875676.1 hypothetical protein [Salmonella enterica]MJK45002.1 hypothetical protein [Salmonella enterica subsp. diarizonae]
MKNTDMLLKEYLDVRQMKPLESMTLEEYQYHLKAEHFLFVEGHNILVDDFTGRHFAATKEQLDLLIGWLQGLRGELFDHNPKDI